MSWTSGKVMIVLALFCSGGVLARADLAAGETPNIILILADDLGYGDCGVYNPGSKIKTPHIDQLAREGLRFTDAHSAGSTCTASRYGLLTGINPLRTGVRNTLLHRGEPIIADDEKTIAALLRDEGYVTHMIGKWHLGFAESKSGKRSFLDFSKPLTGGPVDRGFDSFYGMHSSPGASPLCYIRNREAEALPTERGIVEESRGGEKPVRRKVMMSPGYEVAVSSPRFCAEAVTLIHAHAASAASKPLFLYYASPLPHKPWAPNADFKGESGVGAYGDVVMQCDDVVGQITRALKDTGLDANTLLIFASDNGPGPWAVQAMAQTGHAASGVLRGSKAQSWEGGHRVPFIVKWPGLIPPGVETEAIVNFSDLFATLAELLNVDASHRYPGSAADSHSFLSVLRNASQPYRRPGVMFNLASVREGDWKLVSKTRVQKMDNVTFSQFQLFNLAHDPSEQNDVSKAHPERAERLLAEFRKYALSRTLK